jgi:hypothetical protein
LAKTKSTNAVTLGDRSECAGITRLIGVATVPQPRKTGASDPLVTKGSPICVGMYIPMKSAPIPKQSGKHAEQIGSPGSRSEATLGFCS